MKHYLYYFNLPKSIQGGYVKVHNKIFVVVNKKLTYELRVDYVAKLLIHSCSSESSVVFVARK